MSVSRSDSGTLTTTRQRDDRPPSTRQPDDPDLDMACRQTLDEFLEPEESVWAVIRGRHGSMLVGTDRRLFSMPPGCPRERVESWPYADLDDLRVVGDGILVRRRRDRHHLVTIPNSDERLEQTMQAVTIVELLIARHAHDG